MDYFQAHLLLYTAEQMINAINATPDTIPVQSKERQKNPNPS